MLSNFAGSASAYTATFALTPSSTASGTVSVKNDKFSDTLGNLNKDQDEVNNKVSIAPSVLGSGKYALTVIVNEGVLGPGPRVLARAMGWTLPP